MSLLEMSVSAVVLILAVVVIRSLAINRLPKKTFLVLWGVVLCRLLIPFSVPSPLSVYTLMNRAGQSGVTVPNLSNIGATTVGGTFAEIQQATLPEDVPMVPWAAIIWAVGFAACTLFFVVSYLLSRRKFQTAIPVKDSVVTEWLDTHPIWRHIKISQSDRVKTPLCYGILRPVILLPKKMDLGDKKQLKYVLTHEYTHIRRFDGATKLLLTAALCVHWFNPLVWVMVVLANRDIELSCDEAVVHAFGDTVKSSYARALIGMEERKSGLMPFCNNFCKNAIEERITAIMKFKKSSSIGIAVAIMLVAGTTTVFATSAIAASTQHQQAVLANQNDSVVPKGAALIEPNVSDIFGVYSKDNGNKISGESDGIATLEALQAGDYYGEPIEKGSTENVNPSGNVVYFNSEADRDNHLRALEANTAKGINRYTGFESMYADIDTNEPITYLVGENLMQFDNSGTIKNLVSYPFFQPDM